MERLQDLDFTQQSKAMTAENSSLSNWRKVQHKLVIVIKQCVGLYTAEAACALPSLVRKCHKCFGYELKVGIL